MAINVTKRGMDLLRDSLLNKGTAFNAEEKERFGLNGLLPATEESLDEQLIRCLKIYHSKKTRLGQHIYLRSIQDRNEVLFYRLLLENLEEMLPVIYTPVVGQACQLFSQIYRQPRGLFLSYPERDKMDAVIASIAAVRTIKVIVVTDGERVLGLGDQGIGGLGISIGKLSLYTCCAGIEPSHTLPILLDVGTNNLEKLTDKEYLGWRHERITGEAYDDFVAQFIECIKRHMPGVLVQFEDFAQRNAYPLLQKYQNQLCSFNDDIQGTASVAVAAIIAATSVTQTILKDQRIVFLGAGSAGCGISELLVKMMNSQGLSEDEALSRFYLVDQQGLLDKSMEGLLPFQRRFAKNVQDLADWTVSKNGKIELIDVIRNVKPTILLGVSGQANQFTRRIVRAMAQYCQRPIIFPLSNPTSHAEASPADLLEWTDGKALVATGSPFESVEINGVLIPIAQCNNAYIFPGIGLGVVAGQVKRVTDRMFMAAALALSELTPARSSGLGRLLPELANIREVSQHIAKAVIREAINEGHAVPLSEIEMEKAIRETMWVPQYQAYL